MCPGKPLHFQAFFETKCGHVTKFLRLMRCKWNFSWGISRKPWNWSRTLTQLLLFPSPSQNLKIKWDGCLSCSHHGLIQSKRHCYRVLEDCGISKRAKEASMGVLVKDVHPGEMVFWGHVSLPSPYCSAWHLWQHDGAHAQNPRPPPPCFLEDPIFLHLSPLAHFCLQALQWHVSLLKFKSPWKPEL